MSEKQTKRPYVQKAPHNEWCARCGGGGEWLERNGPALEHHVCPVCKGAGVVDRQKASKS